MPEPLPKQRWLVQWLLKSGAVFESVTEMDEVSIISVLKNSRASGDFALITCFNAKGWPVQTRIRDVEIASWTHSPHEVYLAQRPNLAIT